LKKIILTVIFLPAGETKLVFAGKKTFLPRKETGFSTEWHKLANPV